MSEESTEGEAASPESSSASLAAERAATTGAASASQTAQTPAEKAQAKRPARATGGTTSRSAGTGARTAKPVAGGAAKSPARPAAKPAAAKTAKPAARSGATKSTSATTPRTPRAKATTPVAPPVEPIEDVSTTEVEVEAEFETTQSVAVTEQVTVPASEVLEVAERAKAPETETVVEVTEPQDSAPVLELSGLTKRYGDFRAADDITLTLDAGTFTGIVGPNGAGKTTTLSMITGLLRPSSGTVKVAGIDVWRNPVAAKRLIGVLPDRLHTFDRLTGGQLLYYTGVLHGLDRATARRRTTELAEAFRVEHAMSRLVTDYSSGMLKKIALAAALIHAPRVLVLDEPFESVDPVSAMTVAQILRDFAAGGGTVLLSSHSMELVQRICDHVAVIVDGRLIAGGTVDEVRGDQTLQERFIELAGSDDESIADLTWLHRFSG